MGKDTPTYTPTSIKPGWGFIPSWWKPRTSWIPNPTRIVVYQPGTDEEALRVSGAAPEQADQPIGDKPIVGPPPGFEQPFNAVVSALSATPSIGRSTTESVWDCLGPTNTKNGRLGSALVRGTSGEKIVAAFTQANRDGKFADAHYDGSDIWYGLMYPQDIDGTTGAVSHDLKPTYDAEAAYDRLITLGVGYYGNVLDPALVEASIAAVTNRPNGYEKSDPVTVLFVFAYSLDTLPNTGTLMVGGPHYADVYAALTPQQVLDREKAVRESGGVPSGIPEFVEPLPPAGHGKKVPKAK